MSKSIIGYDLNERYCQISFYSEEHQEPQTLESVPYPAHDLYMRAVRHESDEMIHMLGEFVKKTLSKYENIEQLTFTVPELNIDIARMLKGIGKRAGVDKENIYVQDYKESFCH